MTPDQRPADGGEPPGAPAAAADSNTGGAGGPAAPATKWATLEPDAGDVLPYGPYRGCTVREVAVIDPSYLADLVAEGVGTAALRAAAARALLRRWPTPCAAAAARPGVAGLPPNGVRWRVPLRAAAAGVLTVALLAGLGALRSAVFPPAPPAPAVPTFAAGPAQGAGPAAPSPGLAAAPGAPSRPARPALAPPPGTATPCGRRVPGAVTAAAAHDAVGTYQGVEFRVVAAKDTGRVTFLNSHDPYQGHFYVAVFPADYDRFPRPPAELFLGRCVVVQGTVELYRGTPQIVLRGPDDVRVLPDEGPP